jgi:hypothetical protein
MTGNRQRAPATPLSDHYEVFYLLGHEETNAIASSWLSDSRARGKSIETILQTVVNAYDNQDASRTLAKIMGGVLSGVPRSRRATTRESLEKLVATKLDEMWAEQKVRTETFGLLSFPRTKVGLQKLEIPEPASAARTFVLFADLNANDLISRETLHHQVDKALDNAHSPELIHVVVHSLMFRSTTGIGAPTLSYESWGKAIAKVNEMNFDDGGELVRLAEQCQHGRVSYYELQFEDGGLSEARAKVSKICNLG